MNWLKSLLPGRAKSSRPTTRLRRQTGRCRPAIEPLEDRLQPSASVITSNFNGTAIAAGSTVWFNSVLKVSGLGANSSKELTEPLKTKLKLYELPDWQNATAEIQITSPQP